MPYRQGLTALAATFFAVLLLSCGNVPTPQTCEDISLATSRGGASASNSITGDLVRRVIDGDTIELANGRRLRYIGIDTPELDEPFYRETADYNRQLVEGRRVRLLKDRSDRDRHGRLLRYVFAGDILVNAELVREGLAEAKTYEPDTRFTSCFDALMEEARQHERGMWRP